MLGRRGYRIHLVEAETTLGGHLRNVRAAARPRRMGPGGRAARDAASPHGERRDHAGHGRGNGRRSSGLRRRPDRARDRRALDRRRRRAASARTPLPGSIRRSRPLSRPSRSSPARLLGDEVVGARFRRLLHGRQPGRTAGRCWAAGDAGDPLRPRCAIHGFHARGTQPAPHDAREEHCRAYRPLGGTGGAGGQRRRARRLRRLSRRFAPHRYAPAGDFAAAGFPGRRKASLRQRRPLHRPPFQRRPLSRSFLSPGSNGRRLD